MRVGVTTLAALASALCLAHAAPAAHGRSDETDVKLERLQAKIDELTEEPLQRSQQQQQQQREQASLGRAKEHATHEAAMQHATSLMAMRPPEALSGADGEPGGPQVFLEVAEGAKKAMNATASDEVQAEKVGELASLKLAMAHGEIRLAGMKDRCAECEAAEEKAIVALNAAVGAHTTAQAKAFVLARTTAEYNSAAAAANDADQGSSTALDAKTAVCRAAPQPGGPQVFLEVAEGSPKKASPAEKVVNATASDEVQAEKVGELASLKLAMAHGKIRLAGMKDRCAECEAAEEKAIVALNAAVGAHTNAQAKAFALARATAEYNSAAAAANNADKASSTALDAKTAACSGTPGARPLPAIAPPLPPASPPPLGCWHVELGTTQITASDLLYPPQGWTAMRDQCTGATYYKSINSGATSWFLPPPAAAGGVPAMGPCSPPFGRKGDPAYGTPYSPTFGIAGSQTFGCPGSPTCGAKGSKFEFVPKACVSPDQQVNLLSPPPPASSYAPSAPPPFFVTEQREEGGLAGAPKLGGVASQQKLSSEAADGEDPILF